MSTESLTRKLFTVDEFQRMNAANIFPPDTFFELIRGEIVEMPKPQPRHAGRVNKLNRLFTLTFGESAVVSVQNQLVIEPHSEPRPDIAVCKPLPELFGPFGPEPTDLFFLVEISDTSLSYDSGTKAKLYAESGVPEYWILNIPDGVLEVRTDPAGGEYRRVEVLRSGQTVSPQLLPGAVFNVVDILK